MPTTLLTLKEDSVRGYRLRSLVQGTVPSPGNTTLFYDNNRQEPAGTFDRVDAFVKFTNGLGVASVNLNVVRRVTGFSTGNYTVTFAPAVTASVPSGTTYDVFTSFDPDNDVRLAINSALRDMAPERMVNQVATTVEVASQGYVSVPSAAHNAVTQFTKLERSVGTLFSDWNWETLIEGIDFKRVDYAGALVVELQYVAVASMGLRFTGTRPASELTNDTDTTDEPSSLIVLGARKYLALAEGDAAAAAAWGREFEAAKVDYYKNQPPKRLVVPHFFITPGRSGSR